MAFGGFEMDTVFKTDNGVFNYRVAGVWIEKDAVLLHKNINDNHWALPGGRVSMMEESKVAVEREFLEELGIQMKTEKFLWSTENFFTHQEEKIHEIGFYYLVSPIETYPYNPEPFFGIEGERLIYQWIPFEKLEDVSLQPAFLKEALMNVSKKTRHIAIRD